MAKRLRILTLTDRYPPHYTGGYEIVCHTVMERLRARGHTVTVLTSNYGLRGTGIEGYVRRLLHRPQDSLSLLQLARREFSDNHVLRQLVESFNPEIVSVWSMLQLFPSLHVALQELKIPVVFNLHDLWLPKHIAEGESRREVWLKPGSNPVKTVAKSVIRAALKSLNPNWLSPVDISQVNLDHIVFCSDYQRSRHQQAGLPLKDWQVIYNGLDLSHFSGTPSFDSDQKLKILFVGRLVSEKGAHIAIESVNELVRSGIRRISLSIAGVPAFPWDYSDRLHAMVKEYELEEYVSFLGLVPNQELPSVYRQHDVLVFPSSHLEGLPMTLLEAMACGLAVIGTTSGGNVELLEDGTNSLTLPNGDPQLLADSIARLLEDPALTQSLAYAGQKLIRKRFDIEAIVDQTEDYLRSLLSN